MLHILSLFGHSNPSSTGMRGAMPVEHAAERKYRQQWTVGEGAEGASVASPSIDSAQKPKWSS